MARKTRDVEAALKNKGFRMENSHHRFFVYHTLDGKKTVVKTYTSQGGKDLDDYLMGQMAKQCRLSKANFGNLVDCPLSQAEYEKQLIADGHVSNPAPPSGGKKN